MKIEIWSDYVCPYCYIGERNLENALVDIKDKDDIEIIYRTFQLDPNASYEVTGPTLERVARKYGYTLEQAQGMIDNVDRYAKSVGLEYRYGTTLYTNTFDTHRIAKYAQSKGKGIEISEKLFHAYFIDNLKLSDYKLLIDIAVEVGLDKEEVEEVLNDKQSFADEIQNDSYEAGRLGIRSVPFFLIDGKYSVLGAQSSEVLKEVIEKAKEQHY